MQFPYPTPDQPSVGPPSLFECLAIVWIVVSLISFCLPRPWFVALFKIAYPFMPDRLEDFDDK